MPFKRYKQYEDLIRKVCPLYGAYVVFIWWQLIDSFVFFIVIIFRDLYKLTLISFNKNWKYTLL
jgi:hypothetical protein